MLYTYMYIVKTKLHFLNITGIIKKIDIWWWIFKKSMLYENITFTIGCVCLARVNEIKNLGSTPGLDIK